MIKITPKDPSACPGYMLDLWCFYERVSKTELAKRLKITRNYIHLVINGKRRYVGKALADCIERVTNGYVKAAWLRRPRRTARYSKGKKESFYSNESVKKMRELPVHRKVEIEQYKARKKFLKDKE